MLNFISTYLFVLVFILCLFTVVKKYYFCNVNIVLHCWFENYSPVGERFFEKILILFFIGLSVIICLLYVKMLHITVITPLQRTNATGIKIIDSLRFRRHMFEQVNVFHFLLKFIKAFFLFCPVVSFFLKALSNSFKDNSFFFLESLIKFF